ncbi:hypothetical protein [Bartonella sp. DGB1]|uniref:hypothetical protein n=1 Tax=Bartonella sp. DGB1 TaxID=3239807 RepID=UPI0035232064
MVNDIQLKRYIGYLIFIITIILWNNDWYVVINLIIVFILYRIIKYNFIRIRNILTIHHKLKLEESNSKKVKKYINSNAKFTKILWQADTAFKLKLSYSYKNNYSFANVLLHQIKQDNYQIREWLASFLLRKLELQQLIADPDNKKHLKLLQIYQNELHTIKKSIKEIKAEYNEHENNAFEIYLFITNLNTNTMEEIHLDDIYEIYNVNGKKIDFRGLISYLGDKNLYNNLKCQGFFDYEKFY